MKSKLSLRNLAKAGLLLKITILFLFSLSGCTSSTAPTFSREKVPEAIRDICKKEYNIDVVTRLVGETLWIYIPVEDMFIPSEEPEKTIRRFTGTEESLAYFKDGAFKLDYKIESIPETEELHEYKYNKAVQEKVGDVWKVLRRVIFSMDRKKKYEPKFYCIITADIKNGVESRELFYYSDLKKVSYGLISWEEYFHRAISDTGVSESIIGDKEGKNVDYRDFTMEDFIARQIKHRINLKFQKPEVEADADIDKEILKIAVSTLKIYGFKDFSEVQLYNFLTENRIILNRPAVEAGSID